MTHPQLYFRDCAHCLVWWYDEERGKVITSGGKDQKRNVACPPPCRTAKGCPKGTAEKPIQLSDANAQAVQHYRECRAVGNFPDDPIVRRNAAIIRQVEDQVEREHQERCVVLASMK